MKKISNLDRFYEYSEKDELGSGAFASVYKGVNCQNSQDVAIKVIVRSKLKKYGEEIINAIGDEVNILQKISIASNKDPCVNIVGIYDCFQTTNHIYIILEFCNGGNLMDVIKVNKQGIPEQQAIVIFYQIVNAVAYMSRHDIVHRDIKPENIFIHNGIYKLGDFGFASQKDMLHTTLGTYPYMAPEFFKESSYDKSVDIWAIGVMYHEMLFSELYFFGCNQYEVSQNICNKPYKIINEQKISPNSRDILMKCIEKDRKKRITADVLIQHPLFDPIKADLSLLRPTNIEEEAQQYGVSQAVLTIHQRLINTRNGLLFLTQLAETLEQNFSEQCKFYIFSLHRKCLNGLNGLLMSLQQGIPPSFLSLKEQDWALFLQSPKYNENIAILSQDQHFITQKFQFYGQYLNSFIRQAAPQQYSSMMSVINTNDQQIIDPNVFKAQIKQCFDYFFEKYNQQGDNKLLLLAMRLAIAMNIDSIILNNSFDFEQLQKEVSNYQTKDLINAIQIATSV